MYKFLLIILLSAISCTEDKQIQTTNTSDVNVSIKHSFDTNELIFNTNKYNNSAGNELSISRLRYFVSNVKLEKENGEILELNGQYFYIDPANNKSNLSLKNIENGKYKKMSFDIGVDSATNHSDPSKFDASHPLSLINHNLHWGWIDGYIFLSFEGRLFNNDLSQPFTYHIGFDRNLKTISLDNEFEVADRLVVMLNFNLSKILSSPNLIDQSMEYSVTHSTNDNGLSDRLVENLSEVFTFQGAGYLE